MEMTLAYVGTSTERQREINSMEVLAERASMRETARYLNVHEHVTLAFALPSEHRAGRA